MTEDKMIRMVDSENRETFSKGSNIVDSKVPTGFRPPPVASLVTRPPSKPTQTPIAGEGDSSKSQD